MLADVVIAALIVLLVLLLVNLLPLDVRTKQLVRAVVVVLGLLYLLRYIAI